MAKVPAGMLKLPFYVRASLIITGLFLFVTMLALAKSIIVPLVFSIVLSILLSTIVDFLERQKVQRIFAIWISLFLAAGVLVLVGMWIISQFNTFIEQLPELNERFDILQRDFAQWLSENLGVNPRKTHEWINMARTDVTTITSEKIGNTISFLTNAVVILVLIPVYIFLILYYQPLIIDFIHRFVGDGYAKDVGIILGQSKSVLKAYFSGLFIELVIVGVLNAVGLLILDVQSAILIGILGGFLNLIPYIGGIVMLGLSMLMALLSHPEPKYAIYAAGLFFIIQIIDNYFLIPKVVGSRVRINALVAVVAVIAGGAIWGVVGMFLALPITAILKVIFDRIEPLQPWGYLLGDTMPPAVKLKFGKKRQKA